MVGKTNGDHWFCYLWEEKKKVPYAVAGDSGDSETDLVEAFVEEPFLAPGPNDQTLEILMCDLDVAHAQCLFYKEKGLDACGRSLVVRPSVRPVSLTPCYCCRRPICNDCTRKP